MCSWSPAHAGEHTLKDVKSSTRATRCPSEAVRFVDVQRLAGPPFNTASACQDISKGQGDRRVQSSSRAPPQGKRYETFEPSTLAGFVPQRQASGSRYYAFRIVFTNDKTVGTGACSGCYHEGVGVLCHGASGRTHWRSITAATARAPSRSDLGSERLARAPPGTAPLPTCAHARGPLDLGRVKALLSLAPHKSHQAPRP